MNERIDIGIDGGGTGCRVVVRLGTRVVRATGGPANVISDPAGAEAAIRLTLIEALSTFSLGLEDLADARIVAGLAGCRLPGAADDFAMRLPFLAYVVDDSVTALEGAFGGADGTLVNLGTGSFFIRRDARGVTHHGGWGFHLGDEGSAAWLGRMALSTLLKIEDGSFHGDRDDPLVHALLAACDVHPVLFARDAGPEDFAALAPLVFNTRSRLSEWLEQQLIGALKSGLAGINHPDGTPWALIGGLGRALAERLDGQITAGLRGPQSTALEGALSMAKALP